MSPLDPSFHPDAHPEFAGPACIISPAVPDQAATLSEIAFLSKAHWGYSAQQMASWKEDFLTLSPDYIRDNRVWVAAVPTRQQEQASSLVGFAAIVQEGDVAILDHLWILPACIGHGVGRKLFLHVASIVPEFEFTSDPNAEGFYERLGAIQIGVYQSARQNRTLKKYRYSVRPAR